MVCWTTGPNRRPPKATTAVVEARETSQHWEMQGRIPARLGVATAELFENEQPKDQHEIKQSHVVTENPHVSSFFFR